ncbi:serine/threonine-protein kinase 11-interacting protein [Copidosoma floridanum]|uniref:serine/threonine-protein kinase 11-interacting protein n=1 Tax=Copidosoma floridanum TaxID=29053 RepID=UPI0006C9ADF0|nr:serine/threonine-protein kinase 11-interacting protein [Copidosoma floridanum]
MSKLSESKKITRLAGMQEISELAKLLRNSGDKVLSASSKLSLSTKLLHDLNEAFSMIINETDDLECSFQVSNSSRSEIFRDIKFLHDLVQKTIGLKIQHNPIDPKFVVDITKFRHLKYLELQKISINSVKGIQGIRSQLECIVCSGGQSVNNLHELLVSCGSDGGVGFVWSSLHRLALPYNALTNLDKSLENVPFLETIDLSHNLITRATNFELIPNLKHVNLGYNYLEHVPLFSKTSIRTLQKLVLKNNYIDNIDGLDRLEYLTELDLSYNCLTEHAMLWPLETMSMLIWLCLSGNPLSHHPRHRLHTIKHLHPSLSDSKFVLDSEPLSKSERLFVSENRVFSLRTSMRRRELDSTTSSINSSWDQTSLPKSHYEDIHSVETRVIEPLTSSLQPRAAGLSKKRRSVREAIIAEDELDREKPKLKPGSLSSSFREMSTEHLETKRQILALRAKYGEENWMRAQAVSHILGLNTKPAIGKDASGSVSSYSSTFDQGDRLSKIGAGVSTIVARSANVDWQQQQSSEFKSEEVGCSTADGTTTQKKTEYESMDEGIVIETELESDLEKSSATLRAATHVMLETTYDPKEEEGDLYLLQKKKGPDDYDMIFLVITPEEIKERDSLNGKINYRWATNTVLSCVLGRSIPTTIDITFDTMRKDRASRTYLAELEDAKKIAQTLNEMIRTQPIMLKIFKCMKCSTHFSQDSDSNAVTIQTVGAMLKCPTCKSTLVIQTDDLLTPILEPPVKIEKANVESQEEVPTEPQLFHSSSQSSIGSATSLEESRESTPSTRTVAKKYESDIEILSNPSQSSIEVLDDGSKSITPRRKRSSEERKVAIAPALVTIPDTNLVMAGLTESSSSGSLTDSVCTAYEKTAANKLSDKSEMFNSRGGTDSDAETIKPETLAELESSFAPMTNLTTMLGELLQSMKIGTVKDATSKSEESSEFISSSIQYSYTDFSNVDHRIKLHIILNVFEHENEDLVLLLRADILTRISMNTFPGCLVMSTAKVYILKITGPEGEDPQRWLHKEASWTIDRLRCFAPLPFKQGVLVELQHPNKPGEGVNNNLVVCILQDFQRTSNFLFYLTDSPLPASCEVEFIVPQNCNTSMKDILKSSKSHRENDSVRLLALFSSAVLTLSIDTVKLKVSSLIVTQNNLIVTQDKIDWLLSDNSDKLPTIASEQAMSNLIEVNFNGSKLTLSFLDEVAGAEAIWCLSFVSPGAAETVINSIRPPWEEMFSVPLQVINSDATAALPIEHI